VDALARFTGKYEVDPSGCWLWTAAKFPNGYGAFWTGSKMTCAHRAGYELLVGPVAAEHDLDHLCRVRACVNPEHLEPVTRRENLMRGAGLSALNAAKTHCVHGHEFTEENTGTTVRGGRRCRACDRDVHARQRERLRAVAA